MKNVKKTLPIISLVLILLCVSISQTVYAIQPSALVNTSYQWTASSELYAALAKNEDNISQISAQYYHYKENLSGWQRKIDDVILSLIDPNYPRFGIAPTTPNQLKYELETDDLYLTVNNVSKKFQIEHPSDDLIDVEISVDSGNQTEFLDPYLVNNTGHSSHLVYGWVYVKDVPTIASFEKVRFVYLATRPVTSYGLSASENLPTAVITNNSSNHFFSNSSGSQNVSPSQTSAKKSSPNFFIETILLLSTYLIIVRIKGVH